MKKAQSHFQNTARQKQKSSTLQHWHIFSNVTTETTAPCSKKQKRLISDEVNSVSCKNFAHLWHCFTFQSSQDFLTEPASKLFHSFTHFKDKNHSVYTNHLCLWSSVFLASPELTLCSWQGFYKKTNNMSCPQNYFSHCPPHRNSESSQADVLVLPASSSDLL